jgi:hypothetical protein
VAPVAVAVAVVMLAAQVVQRCPRPRRQPMKNNTERYWQPGAHGTPSINSDKVADFGVSLVLPMAPVSARAATQFNSKLRKNGLRRHCVPRKDGV